MSFGMFRRVRSAASELGIDRWCAGVVVVALIVLLPGSWWGLPHATTAMTVRGWDVDGVAGIGVLSELHNLFVEPKADWYTAYPLLHYLILGVSYAPYLAVVAATGGLEAPSPSYPFGLHDPVGVLRGLSVIARVISLAMACGTVAVTYLTARALWDPKRGVIAAILMTLTVPFVFYGRTGNLDVPVLFWTALAVFIMVRVQAHGLSTSRAVALGLASAFAVATKDQAFGALVPGLLAISAGAIAGGRSPSVDSASSTTPQRWRAVAVLVVTGAVAFAVANGIPIRPERFMRHIRFVANFEQTFTNVQYPNTLTLMRDASLRGYMFLLGDMTRAIVLAVGGVVTLAGLAGAAVYWRRTPSSRVLVWMLAGFVVLTIFPIRHVQYRYALFPAFVLSLFAAALLVDLARLPRPWALIGRAALVVAVGWPLLWSVDLGYQMIRDARFAAGDWLGQRARPGDQVAFFGEAHQLPHIPAGVGAVDMLHEPNAVSRLAAGEFRFVVVAADYYAGAERNRSVFLPDSIYRSLQNGSLGLRRTGHFVTSSLLGRPFPYLPYVNPEVQIFEHTRPAAGGEPGRR